MSNLLFSYIEAAIALPVLGFVLLALFGRKLPDLLKKWIPTVMMFSVTLLIGIAAVGFFKGEGQTLSKSFTWLNFQNGLELSMGIQIDALSMMMLCVISLVSFLVHFYSTAYMHGEERLASYYAYLQLFTVSMMSLVVSVNLFQIYFFWELVGVSSFLLIGFYCTQPKAIAAAKKAFIVTRFADFFMLIGILVLGLTAHSFDLKIMAQNLVTAHAQLGFMGISAVSWGAFLIFIGGAGKSAMFPLHVWLPDAMEGPTPVSALIHAATMVVAGVFLVARMFAVYALAAPEVLEIIAYIGAITSLFAALVACTQTDFKKVLAYSTISQIALMMLGLGVAGWGVESSEGYVASLFHLFTHAFFKAGLFLCAGMVIHAVGTGDLNKLGGLRKYFPITHAVFLIAALAISGIPFFAGFYSKEAILFAAYKHSMGLFVLATLSSALTAFYMFRLYFMVFHYQPSDLHKEHAHEPVLMSLPLLILGVLSVAAGYVDFGRLVHLPVAEAAEASLHTHIGFSILPVGLAVLAIALAYRMYYRSNMMPEKARAFFGSLYVGFYHKLYIDQAYEFFAKRMMIGGLGSLIVWIDTHIVQRAVVGSGESTRMLSESIKRIQSGRIQNYGYYFLGGVVAIAAILLVQYWI